MVSECGHLQKRQRETCERRFHLSSLKKVPRHQTDHLLNINEALTWQILKSQLRTNKINQLHTGVHSGRMGRGYRTSVQSINDETRVR